MLVAQMVKHLPAIQETWVQSLGREVPLKKEMSTHSSILARRFPWTEEPGRLQSIGSQRVGHDWCDLALAQVSTTGRLSHWAFQLRRTWRGRGEGSVLQMGALCSLIISVSKVVKNFRSEELCKELISRKIVYIFLAYFYLMNMINPSRTKRCAFP